MRTGYAVANGNCLRWGALLLGGLMETGSIFINVAGEARQAWGLDSKAPPSSNLPTVTNSGFVTV